MLLFLFYRSTCDVNCKATLLSCAHTYDWRKNSLGDGFSIRRILRASKELWLTHESAGSARIGKKNRILFYRIHGAIDRCHRFSSSDQARSSDRSLRSLQLNAMKESRHASFRGAICSAAMSANRSVNCDSARCFVVTSARDHHRPGMSRLNQIPPAWTQILPTSAR